MRYIRTDRRRVKCVTQLTARATSPCVNTSTNTLPGVNICSVNMATCWQRLKQCVLLWVGSCLKSGIRWDAAALKHTARDSGTSVPRGTTVLGQVLEWKSNQQCNWNLRTTDSGADSSSTDINEYLVLLWKIHRVFSIVAPMKSTLLYYQCDCELAIVSPKLVFWYQCCWNYQNKWH